MPVYLYGNKVPLNHDCQKGSNAGQQHYENLCMKAVNQCIGRAVRHKADYATVLLLDHRYSRTNTRRLLPGWIQDSLQTHDKIGPAIGAIAKVGETQVKDVTIFL